MENTILLPLALLLVFGALHYLINKLKSTHPKAALFIKCGIWLVAGVWMLFTPDARTHVMWCVYLILTYTLLKEAWLLRQNKQLHKG
jgi:hypothetical protein